MPKSFDFSNPPYDRLTAAEASQFREALDIAFFPTDHTIIHDSQMPEHLYVVIKGFVEERDGDEAIAMYGALDTFDTKALVEDSPRHGFIVREEAICYQVPKALVLDLTRANRSFGAFFQHSISEKLDGLAVRTGSRELQSLMMARVRQAYLHPPLYVNATMSIYDAGSLMKSQQANALLVRAGDEFGIVTAMSIFDAILLRNTPFEAPVGAIANFDLLTVDADDFLFNALVLLTKHKLRRLVVLDAGEILGLLEEIDLLSFFSNHSHIIAIQVARSETPQELKQASESVVNLIDVLHANGVKIGFISQVVAELTQQVLARLFEMLAPPEMIAHSCLVVMGSEGRGEQIMKTDQDNAVILRDGIEFPGLEKFREDFTEALLDFGYPRCPGNIMVSNPNWSKPMAAYSNDLKRWILTPDDQAPLNLAIFYDAIAVAGDETLLDDAKTEMFQLLGDNDAFYSQFARAINAFDTPLGMFFNLVVTRGSHGDVLDLKRGGIFPLVHGARSLALAYKLRETNTVERIRRLQALGLYERSFADELIDAFAYLQAIRLKTRLVKSKLGQPADNLVRPAELTTLERDLLKESLFVVKKFKEFVSYHFKLTVF